MHSSPREIWLPYLANSKNNFNNQISGRVAPPHKTDNDMKKMKLTVHRCLHFRDWQYWRVRPNGVIVLCRKRGFKTEIYK